MEVNVSNFTIVETDLGSSMAISGSGDTDVATKTLSVLLYGLDPCTNYTFYVLAVTLTKSEASDDVTLSMDEAGKICIQLV